MTFKSNFIVLSHGRTGSTYVVSELNTHPEIRMYYELFHDSPDHREAVNGEKWESGSNAWDFIQRNVFNSLPEGRSTVGFKLFYFHLPLQDPVWKELQADQSINLILLHRENIFAGFVSEERARVTNVWHPTETDKSYDHEVKITLDMVKARRYFERNLERQRFGKNLVADRDHLFMTYEDLVMDATSTMARMVKYLGVDVKDWRPSPFLTGSADRTRTVIMNIDEVSGFLAEKQALWMLEPYR